MNNFEKNLITIAILFILLTISSWFMILQSEKKKPLSPLATSIILSDYQSLENLTKEILIENKLSNMENKDDEDLTKNLKAYGDFSKIYLFAEISVNERPLTDWDSIYIKFNNYIDNTLEEFNSGGHLFRPKSLSVPQIKTTTRLLFNASVVPYIPTIPYSETRTPATINWFENVFRSPQNPKEERRIRFDTFLSTTEKGFIKEISLFYKCSKDTPDCYIEIIKNEEKSD